MSVLKVCTWCKEEKSIDDFNKGGSRSGYQARCKPCRKATRGKASETSTKNYRNHQLQQRYGITAEQYDVLLVAQDYRCAICGQHQDDLTRQLAVDHDHQTGAVRGLLCRGCNTGIGNLGDDAGRVLDAYTYLTRNVVPL